jgi:hypothetical protein
LVLLVRREYSGSWNYPAEQGAGRSEAHGSSSSQIKAQYIQEDILKIRKSLLYE